jgi:hypothetical protein
MPCRKKSSEKMSTWTSARIAVAYSRKMPEAAGRSSARINAARHGITVTPTYPTGRIRPVHVFARSVGRHSLQRVNTVSCENIAVSPAPTGAGLRKGEKDMTLEEKMDTVLNDPVNHPSHYTSGKIEVIDFIEDQKFPYHLGNACKYLCRAGKKDPEKTAEDLRKAVWYINRYIDLLEKEAAK